MQHLEGSGTPVLYVGRIVLKGYVRNPIIKAVYFVPCCLCEFPSLKYEACSGSCNFLLKKCRPLANKPALFLLQNAAKNYKENV
jgi:hypothetical protein